MVSTYAKNLFGMAQMAVLSYLITYDLAYADGSSDYFQARRKSTKMDFVGCCFAHGPPSGGQEICDFFVLTKLD